MKLFFSLVLLFMNFISHAQNKQTQSLSAELGKNGLLVSIIYDYQFSTSHFGLRAGAGSNFAKYLQAYTATIGGYKLFGTNNRYFELGADIQYLDIDEVSDDQKGFTLVYPDFSTSTLYPSLNIGYRKYNKKSIFRAGVSPGFTKHGFLPGAYLSFGFIW